MSERRIAKVEKLLSGIKGPEDFARERRVDRAVTDDGRPRLDILDGLRVQSPDGTVWTLRVSNDGVLSGEGVTVGGDTVVATWAGITGKPSTFPPSAHNHDERYYTEAEMDTALDAKADQTFVVANDLDLQGQINGKANTSHTHDAGDVTSGTFATARIPSLPASQIGSGTLDPARLPSVVRDDTLTLILDGNGSALPLGREAWCRVPWACTITGWTLLGDVSGSVATSIYRNTYAQFPDTAFGRLISAFAGPTISSSRKGQSTSLTGWTTSLAAGDILIATTTGAATSVTRAVLELHVTRG